MELLFYSGCKSDTGERLLAMIRSFVPEVRTELHGTIDSLCHRLRQPGKYPSTALILMDSEKELSDILAIRELLEDMRLILILPDRKDGTIAKGHLMRPRFLSFLDTDYTDVAAVLEKMANNDRI